MLSRTFPKLPANPANILFVCTGNSCRSVMAEALFRKMLASEGLSIHVHSAGTAVAQGRTASAPTIEFLNREGLDYRQHASRKVTRRLLEEADLVVVMEKAHRDHVLQEAPRIEEKVFLLSDFYPDEGTSFPHTSIPDPIGMSRFFYDNVGEMILLCCRALCARLKEAVVPARGL